LQHDLAETHSESNNSESEKKNTPQNPERQSLETFEESVSSGSRKKDPRRKTSEE